VKDPPDRLSNLSRTENRGRNLVKQRLENVMIFSIDQRDIDRFISQ
jgi:hypothetical protein